MGKNSAKNADVYNYKGTRREGDNKGKKQTRSCAGNVVQVFGFKNNFPREAGYNGISRKLPVPNKRT